MKVYMTNGTLVFLKQIAEKHPTVQFHYMVDGHQTMAYYENHPKKIFTAGRAYHALLMNGTVQGSGYVVIHHIPVTAEDRPTFEAHFKQQQHIMASLSGLCAFRLLKPAKGNTYAVFTQWESERDYERWKNTDTYQTFSNHGVKPPAYFADRSFIANYFMVDEEE